jgi:hypothetical protein
VRLITRPKRKLGDVLVRYRAPLTIHAEPTIGQQPLVDLNAIERVLGGEHPTVPLNPAEARLAWTLITDEHELSAAELAAVLNVTTRTIFRWRASKEATK